MKIHQFIEEYYWVFLLAGIIIGLWTPMSSGTLIALPKPLLMLMMFFVFTKTDALEILENIRDYKLMIYVVTIYMFIIPIVFFFSVKIFDPKLAVGILLLTAMPAGISTPTLTDIAKGNISLSMSLVILTQLIAPFTVPLLFGLAKFNDVAINQLSVFKDMVMVIFIPMLLSQFFKRYFPRTVNNIQHLFTSFNILLLFALVYAAIASQRGVILSDPLSLVWKAAILYLVFILLHAIGYLICYRENKENKVTIAIGAAYMNNGMAIVLAAAYFEPSVLVLMVLSEIPWSTLPAPFNKVIRHL
jgi:bile acid:Na+ symporter, BASS family